MGLILIGLAMEQFVPQGTVKIDRLVWLHCSLSGFTVHEILQARILEWVSIPFSRGSSQPRDQTHICIAGGFFTHRAIWMEVGRCLITQVATVYYLKCFSGLPCGVMVKNLPANAGDMG